MNRRQTAIAVTLIVLVAAAVMALRWWHNVAPYGPEAIEATATVQMMDNAGPNTLHRVPGAFEFRPVEGSWLVQGKVTWKAPPVDEGWFAIAVIDKRVSLKPPHITAVTPDGAPVQGGSDGVLNRVAELHPWLRGAGDINVGDDSWRSGGRALSLSSMTGGVTFVAEFPKVKASDPNQQFYAAGPIALEDIVVGLVFIGDDRQVYWAQRLYG